MKPWMILAVSTLLLAGCSNGASDNDVVRGQQLFAQYCVFCHAIDPGVVIVVPSLAGISRRAASASEELGVREDLRRAILSPGVELAEGFNDLMPSDFDQKLTETDFEALLSYLLTLE